MIRVKLILVCKNCGKTIDDPTVKNQIFCPKSSCAKMYSSRMKARIINKTKPENYMGYNWGKKKQ